MCRGSLDRYETLCCGKDHFYLSSPEMYYLDRFMKSNFGSFHRIPIPTLPKEDISEFFVTKKLLKVPIVVSPKGGLLWQYPMYSGVFPKFWAVIVQFSQFLPSALVFPLSIRLTALVCMI